MCFDAFYKGVSEYYLKLSGEAGWATLAGGVETPFSIPGEDKSCLRDLKTPPVSQGMHKLTTHVMTVMWCHFLKKTSLFEIIHNILLNWPRWAIGLLHRNVSKTISDHVEGMNYQSLRQQYI